MAKKVIKINGLNELRIGLKKNMDLSRVRQVVKYHGARLQEQAIRNAVFKKGYQTGNLRRNIALYNEDSGMTARVKSKAKYSYYVEYGTRFMEAQPYMRPAFRTQSAKFKADIQKLMK